MPAETFDASQLEPSDRRKFAKRQAGLYDKFSVSRNDDRDLPGEKHENCRYFVLDLDHDPHAIPAIKAYAESCRKDGYHELANDLQALFPEEST